MLAVGKHQQSLLQFSNKTVSGKNISISHSARDGKGKMVFVVFPQYPKHDFILTGFQMDSLFSKPHQNNHGVCAL